MANRPEQRVIIVDAETGEAAPASGGTGGSASSIATGQVTLPASSGGSRLIVAARTGRTSVLIGNDNGNAIYVGGEPAVTQSNGYKLLAGQGVTIEGSTAVYAINSSNTASQLVSYMESF